MIFQGVPCLLKAIGKLLFPYSDHGEGSPYRKKVPSFVS